MTIAVESNLWRLVQRQPAIDARELSAAVAEQLRERDLDYRTRLLVRRCVEALQVIWGTEDFNKWMQTCLDLDVDRIKQILAESFGEAGFPSIMRRTQVATDRETVHQYLRELAGLLRNPLQLVIGGSVAGILSGNLHRHTEDIDVPDEVPESIRALGTSLNKLSDRYGLHLSHFQSHYLPDGWQQRLHWLGDFKQLTVYYVDVYDLFIGKLFSRRERDRDDLRILAQSLNKDTITNRLAEASRLLCDDALRVAATDNWYVLYGQTLPDVRDP